MGSTLPIFISKIQISRICHLLCTSVSNVVEFPGAGLWSCCRGWTSLCPNLGSILVNKVFQKLKISKHTFNKSCSPIPIFIYEKKIRKILTIFDKENWCWKSIFPIFCLCSSLRGLSSTIQLRIDSYHLAQTCSWKFHNVAHASTHCTAWISN